MAFAVNTLSCRTQQGVSAKMDVGVMMDVGAKMEANASVETAARARCTECRDSSRQRVFCAGRSATKGGESFPCPKV